MEDFYDAGGLPALLNRIRHRLRLDCLTVTGRTLGDNLEGAQVHNDHVIRPLDQPVSPAGSTSVLRGNLAPDGCVIKPTCAEPPCSSTPAPPSCSATTPTSRRASTTTTSPSRP